MKFLITLVALLVIGSPVAAQSPTPTPEISLNLGTKVFTFDVDGNAGSLTDGASWALSNVRLTRSLSAVGNQFLLNVQPYALVSGSTTGYEKAGILVHAKTSDPSTVLLNRDMVGIDTRSQIVGSNMTGRAWGLFAQGLIETGSDGFLVGTEISAHNLGTDQPLVNTSTSKINLHLVASGNGSTAGILYTASGGGFHKLLYAEPAAILGTHANDSFIELLSTWRVRKDGSTGIGTGSPQYRTHILGANSTPSLSAISGIVAMDGGTSPNNQLVFGGIAGSPFGFWIQSKDNQTSGQGSGTAYTLALNPLGGNVGIGVLAPNARLQVAGDMAVSVQGSGVILRATDGSNCYRLTVLNNGSLVTANVTCP